MVPQHLDALSGANRTRLGRAALRESVTSARPPANGRARLADLLTQLPDVMCGASLEKVLLWPHRTGPVLAVEWRRLAAVTREGSARLDALSERERSALAAVLRGLPVDDVTAGLNAAAAKRAEEARAA